MLKKDTRVCGLYIYDSYNFKNLVRSGDLIIRLEDLDHMHHEEIFVHVLRTNFKCRVNSREIKALCDEIDPQT